MKQKKKWTQLQTIFVHLVDAAYVFWVKLSTHLMEEHQTRKLQPHNWPKEPIESPLKMPFTLAKNTKESFWMISSAHNVLLCGAKITNGMAIEHDRTHSDTLLWNVKRTSLDESMHITHITPYITLAIWCI